MASGVISTDRPRAGRAAGSPAPARDHTREPPSPRASREAGTPPTRTRSTPPRRAGRATARADSRGHVGPRLLPRRATSAPGSNVTDARLKPLSCRRNSLKSAARIVARSSRTRPASSGLSRLAVRAERVHEQSSTPSWRSRTRASAAFRRVRSPTVARAARSSTRAIRPRRIASSYVSRICRLRRLARPRRAGADRALDRHGPSRPVARWAGILPTRSHRRGRAVRQRELAITGKTRARWGSWRAARDAPWALGVTTAPGCRTSTMYSIPTGSLPRAPDLEPKPVAERVVAEVARREEVVVRHDADGGGRTAAVEGEEGEDLAVAPVAAHRGVSTYEGTSSREPRRADAEHRRAHLDHPGDDQQHRPRPAGAPGARRAQARRTAATGRRGSV